MLFAIFLNGFFTHTVFSTSFELAVELSYPIDETNSCGVVNVISTIWAILTTVVLTAILEY